LSISLSLAPLIGEDKASYSCRSGIRDITQEQAEQKQRADLSALAATKCATPVAAIEGYLALALNEKVSTIDAKAATFLEKAHSSTQHLGQLFQDLLTSAKAEDGRLTSHPSVVELGEFLEKLANDLRFRQKEGLSMELRRW